MNKRQRMLADVGGRLMRPGRMYLDSGANGGGGGAATLDLGQKIEIKDPAKDVPAAIEGLRYHLLELSKKPGGVTREEFERGVAEMKVITSQYEATIAQLKASQRDMPDAAWGEGKLKSLKHVQMRLKIDDADLKDRDFGPHMSRLSREQYNIMCSTPKELGIEDDKIASRKLRRMHQLHDTIVFLNLARAKADPNYPVTGGWRSLPMAEEYIGLAKEFAVALGLGDTAAATAGLNWVPSQILSANIIPLIETALTLYAAFENVPMLGPTQAYPVVGSHAQSYLIQENIADDGNTTNAKAIASQFVTNLLTFTAKKHAALVIPSSEWEQDAVINVTQYIERDLAVAIARGRENWLINGQKTSAIDLPAPGATDIRSASDGLRRMFVSTGLTPYDFSAGIGAEGLSKIFQPLGQFGNEPNNSVWVCSVAGYVAMLIVKNSSGANIVMTQAEYGPQATFRTGALGKVWGRDVIPSQFMPDTMDDTGVIPTPVSNKTAILHVHTGAVKTASRAGIAISMSDQIRFFEDQLVFKAVARDDIQPAFAPATNKIIGAGVNVATS